MMRWSESASMSVINFWSGGFALTEESNSTLKIARSDGVIQPRIIRRERYRECVRRPAGRSVLVFGDVIRHCMRVAVRGEFVCYWTLLYTGVSAVYTRIGLIGNGRDRVLARSPQRLEPSMVEVDTQSAGLFETQLLS